MKRKATGGSSVSEVATITKRPTTELDAEIVSVMDKASSSESANEMALVSISQPKNTQVSRIECLDEPVLLP